MGVSRMLVMFTTAIAMAVFVVRERNKIIEIGYQVAKLQKECDELSEANRKLNYHVVRLKSPENIVYKVQSFKLPLILREDSSSIMIAGQIKSKDDALKVKKMNYHKGLYTQKDPLLNCCSLHY